MIHIGAYIIGDEILSGRREDKHLKALIAILAQRGLRLRWAHYLGDDPLRLTEAFRRTLFSSDVVFSFGGIGATPDDHTRQCAAAALGRPLELHPEAEALIRARFGAETTPQRLEMGMFPQGARIIPNPYNQIPGFSVDHHHFVPGFPRMAWPMVEWVLDTYYANYFGAQDWVEESLIVWDVREGELLPLMRELSARYPEATLFSLPSLKEEHEGRWRLELGFKGPAAQVAAAMHELRAALTERRLVVEEVCKEQR